MLRENKIIAAYFPLNVIKMQNCVSGLLFSITCVVIGAGEIKDEKNCPSRM